MRRRRSCSRCRCRPTRRAVPPPTPRPAPAAPPPPRHAAPRRPGSPGGAAPEASPAAVLAAAAERLIAGATTHAAHDWRVPAPLLLSAKPGPDTDELAAQLLAAAPDNAFAHLVLMAKAWHA